MRGINLDGINGVWSITRNMDGSIIAVYKGCVNSNGCKSGDELFDSPSGLHYLGRCYNPPQEVVNGFEVAAGSVD